jgi:hypothetical protein
VPERSAGAPVTVLLVLESVALVLLGILVLGLLRSHAEILRRLHELGVGLEAPGPTGPSGAPAADPPDGPDALDVAGVTPAGEAAAIGVVGAAQDTLLAFLSSSCLTCAGFWEAFARIERLGLPPHTRLLVVTKGPDGESPPAVARLAPADLTVVMSTEAWEGYGVPGSPYFVLVDGPSGRVVGQATGDTWHDVRRRLGLTGSHRPGRANRASNDPDRRERVDAELLAAGIGPGHPSLYADASPEADQEPEA